MLRRVLTDLLRWAKTSAEPVVGDTFTTQQISYLGKTTDAVQMHPYGLFCKIPVDNLSMIFSVQGNPDNRAQFALTPMPVPESENGEVVLYHPKSQTYIILRDNGDVDVSSANVNVITETANIEADEVNIEAPAINLTGDIVHSGNYELTGDMTQTGDFDITGGMTANGKTVDDTHGHAQGPDSDGNGQSPISGVT